MFDYETNDPFYQNCTVKRYSDELIEIIWNKLPPRTGARDTEKEEKEYVGKLENNLIRAKTKIRDYVLCNPWEWWVTLTLNPAWIDRFDLNAFVKKFGEMIHNYNRRNNRQVKYLLVPEKHPTSGAWHFHGFFHGLPDDDIIVNAHGYFEWTKYTDNFGYISMSPLKNKMKAANYITKYLTKTLAENVTACGAHTYYCSKGLQTPIVTHNDCFIGLPWDYVGMYCNKVAITPDMLKTDDFSAFAVFENSEKKPLQLFPLYDKITPVRADKEELSPKNESLQIKMGL